MSDDQAARNQSVMSEDRLFININSERNDREGLKSFVIETAKEPKEVHQEAFEQFAKN